jgi:hypothetical protein
MLILVFEGEYSDLISQLSSFAASKSFKLMFLGE